MKGFRPLSGNYISKYKKRKDTGKMNIGFRPLSGNYISK